MNELFDLSDVNKLEQLEKEARERSLNSPFAEIFKNASQEELSNILMDEEYAS